jgi:hypothetical protein
MVLRLLRLCVEWGVQQDNELQSTARSLALRAAATCADDSLIMIGVAEAMLKLRTMPDDALAIVVREGLKPDDSVSQSAVFVLYSLGEDCRGWSAGSTRRSRVEWSALRGVRGSFRC